MTAAVKAKVGDNGEQLVEAFYLLAFGTSAAIEKKWGAKPTIRDRKDALGELSDRGFGKPTQTVAGDPDQPVSVRVVFGGRHKAA